MNQSLLLILFMLLMGSVFGADTKTYMIHEDLKALKFYKSQDEGDGYYHYTLFDAERKINLYTLKTIESSCEQRANNQLISIFTEHFNEFSTDKIYAQAVIENGNYIVRFLVLDRIKGIRNYVSNFLGQDTEGVKQVIDIKTPFKTSYIAKIDTSEQIYEFFQGKERMRRKAVFIKSAGLDPFKMVGSFISDREYIYPNEDRTVEFEINYPLKEYIACLHQGIYDFKTNKK